MRIFIASSVLALALCTAQAVAQENNDQLPAQPDKCRVVPDDSNSESPKLKDNMDPLDQELGACRGVLTPPPTGDGDIIEQAPEGGKMPIIAPPEVPEQQPSN